MSDYTNSEEKQSVQSFNSTDKITDYILDSYIQHKYINGEFVNDEIDVNFRFSLKVDPTRLMQQAFCVADQILKAQIDPAKIYPIRSKVRVKLAKAYIYSYFKSVNLAIKFPNIDLGEDTLLFRGHHQLFQLINARNIKSTHSSLGSTVNRRIELSESDDVALWEAEYKFSWLRGCKETTTSFRYYNRELEDILFKLKSLARSYKEKKYGLNYVISSIDVKDNSGLITKAKSCYLGNAALNHTKSDSLHFIYSNNVKITDYDVIINPALFISLVNTNYTNGYPSVIKHQSYRSFKYENPMHLLKYEVKAVTGLYPGPFNSDDPDINEVLDSPTDTPPTIDSNDTEGGKSPSGNNP